MISENISTCTNGYSLSGKIYDKQTNRGLPNFRIEINPYGYYGISDEKGNYNIVIDKGDYIASVNYSYEDIVMNYPENYEFGIHTEIDDTTFITVTKDFAVEVLQKPLIKTDLGSTRRRRCFGATTNVSYENVGFARARNTKLTVTYPEFVNPVSANPPWTSREGKVLTWNLGNLPEGESGEIYIQDSVICGIEEIRGLTQCTEVVASYDNRQLTEPVLWDKSDISVSAFCNSGKITLTLRNQGEGDMNKSRKYRLFLDAEFHTEGELQLSTNEEKILEIEPNGKTIRLEADQSDHHPNKSQPSVTQEACGIGELATSSVAFVAISTGKVNELPMDDADEFREIDCMEITDSYDPNDKTAYPKGVTENNYITDTQELEYRVRFQNTGTDTAYLVVVHDSLPEQVDISSLRMGASSHDYTWELKRNETNGKMALICTFKDIYLPHQKIDDAGSNGFFKFKIRQKAGNPKGTEINNQAFIYFDFNSAIITNKTSNIVWDLPLTQPQFRIDKNGNRRNTGQNNSETFENVEIVICGTDYPTEAQTEDNIELCFDTESVILKGNLPEKGTGTWTMIDGSGDISKVSDTEIEVKNLAFGKHILAWQISLCDSISTSQIEIHRKEPINAKIQGEKFEICQNETAFIFENETSADTWKVVSGSGNIQETANGIQVQNLSLGSNIIQKIVGSCDSITTTDFEVYRKEPINVKVQGEKVEICYNEAIVKFQEAGNAENWKLISEAGKITQLSEDEIGIENLAEGSNIFQRIVSSCDSLVTTEFEIFRKENLIFFIENQEDNLSTISADTYQWFLNGIKIEGATEQEYFATEQGDYAVEIEKEGCIFRSEVLSHRLTALEMELNISDFRLYPNPAKNTLNLEFSSLKNSEISLKMMDVLGKEIQTVSVEKTGQKFQKSIAINQLPKGVYYLKIQVDNRIAVRKFVKN